MPDAPTDLEAAADAAVEQVARSTGLPTVFAALGPGADLVVVAARDTSGRLAAGTELRWEGVPDGSASARDDAEAALLVLGIDRPIPTPAYVRASIGDPAVGVLGAFADAPVEVTAAADEEPLETLSLVRTLAALLGQIAALTAEIGDARERAAMAEAESLFDPLTGLGNRRHWSRMLEAEDSRCRRHGLPASVIVADLDALKEVNDRLGHAAGDDMLRRAAGVLRDISRTHDAVARLGGDEFGLLAVDCGGETAEMLARRVQEMLAAEGILASVGFAGRHPAGGLEHAWRRADSVMYADKRQRAEIVVDLTETGHPAG